MTATQATRKICPNGHIFFKSSDCPVCPACEQARKPHDHWLALLAAPARRALESAGINTLEQLAGCSEKEILALHGMGKSSLPKLKAVLSVAGLQLKQAD